MPLPGLFESTVFEPTRLKYTDMEQASRFIRPIHPKKMIAPKEGAIKKVIAAGWWAQPKVHGHRAQIHVPATDEPCLVYNRQGNLHKERLPDPVQTELKRLFQPVEGWNVIDAEWVKPESKIFVFDFLKRNSKVLDGLTFAERYDLLPKLYLSPYISTLPVFKTVERCMTYLASDLPASIEGLVFRSIKSRGFADSTIVRCRL